MRLKRDNARSRRRNGKWEFSEPLFICRPHSWRPALPISFILAPWEWHLLVTTTCGLPHGFSHELQFRSFVSCLRDEGLQDFALMVDGTPQIVGLPRIFTKTSSKCHSAIAVTASLVQIGVCGSWWAKCMPKRSVTGWTASWQISIPRSLSRSSILRSDNRNRTYIITASWMISGDVLKYRNGFWLISGA